MKTDDLERRYVAEILAHRSDRICLELTLVELSYMIAAVQLAQRNPEMPLTLRADLDQIVGSTIEALRDRYPAVAEGMKRGGDPGCDYPREPGRRRR